MCDLTCMNQKKCLKLVFCPFHSCSLFGKKGEENIILHSFYKTSQGRRRRYRCKECGKTFSSTFGTAYYRLQKSKTSFDNVATMSVNGVDKSSISRMTGLSWTTIERWLEIAALYAQNFNEQYLKGYDITEVQADEIRTFVGSRKNVQWLFTAIEVSSRLWISMVVGSRNYQNLVLHSLSVVGNEFSTVQTVYKRRKAIPQHTNEHSTKK